MTVPKAAQRPKQSRRAAKHQGILVLGMHRSGTSACTRVLNLLGCALPADLIGAGDGNEVGHWESLAAVNLNDQMLASAGTSWEDWGPINDDWRGSAIRDDMIEQASMLVAEHANLGPLFALKDPRLCRLADVWLAAMDAARVEPLVILMLRNPTEVSASLESRDLMAPGYGHLLWLRHALDAEYYSRGRRRVVCRYDQLLSNWYGVIDRIKAGLDVALPRNSPAVHAEIDAFLTPHHRHHEQSIDSVTSNPALSVWLRRSFAILLNWSEVGETEADHAELDAIRTEFDRSYGTFARLLLSQDVAGRFDAGSELKRELSTKLAETQNAAAAAQAAIQDAEARLATQAAREAALDAELQAGQEIAQTLQSEIDRLRAEAQRIGQLEDEIAALRTRDAGLTAELAGLHASLQAAGDDGQSLRSEIDRLRVEAQRMAELEGEIAALRTRDAELTAEISGLLDSLQAADDDGQSLRSEIDRLRIEAQRMGELEGEIAALRMREAVLTAEMSGLQDSLLAADGDAQALQAEIDRLRLEAQQLGVLQAETEQLRVREEELTTAVLASQALIDTARGDAGREQENRAVAEQQLASKITELRLQEVQNAEYLGELTTARSAMTQRQEELAQLWAQLLAAEKALGAAEATAAQEGERRQSAERQMASTEHEILALRSQLADARAAPPPDNLIAEIAQLTRMLQQQEAQAQAAEQKSLAAQKEAARVFENLRQQEARMRTAEAAHAAAEQKLTSRFEEIARLTTMLAEETGKSSDADARLADLNREVGRLSDRIHQQETATRAAETARVAAEHKLANRFDEIARLTTMLAVETGKAGEADSNAAWLSEVMRVSEGFPKWWALMPQDWRRKREHLRYQRKKLFDAQQYLELYPDVAEQGMDPIRHFILHGMREGRKRTV